MRKSIFDYYPSNIVLSDGNLCVIHRASGGKLVAVGVNHTKEIGSTKDLFFVAHSSYYLTNKKVKLARFYRGLKLRKIL